MPSTIRTVARRLAAPFRRATFVGSGQYWERRYRAGGTSGDGSYGQLAAFKAEILNAFVQEQGVTSVVEFGCGDGNQLRQGRYPRYLGLDVSEAAIERCIALFADDPTKSFLRYEPAGFRDPARFVHADVALSLDVIFHLVEDATFERYMASLFAAADRFVVIYASNVDMRTVGPHERHRKFTDWIERNQPNWCLLRQVANRYPYDDATKTGSRSDFYFFARTHALSTSQADRGASRTHRPVRRHGSSAG